MVIAPRVSLGEPFFVNSFDRSPGKRFSQGMAVFASRGVWDELSSLEEPHESRASRGILLCTLGVEASEGFVVEGSLAPPNGCESWVIVVMFFEVVCAILFLAAAPNPSFPAYACTKRQSLRLHV